MKKEIYFAFLYGEFQDTAEADSLEEAKDIFRSNNTRDTDYDIIFCYSKKNGTYRVHRNS